MPHKKSHKNKCRTETNAAQKQMPHKKNAAQNAAQKQMPHKMPHRNKCRTETNAAQKQMPHRNKCRTKCRTETNAAQNAATECRTEKHDRAFGLCSLAVDFVATIHI